MEIMQALDDNTYYLYKVDLKFEGDKFVQVLTYIAQGSRTYCSGEHEDPSIAKMTAFRNLGRIVGLSNGHRVD